MNIDHLSILLRILAALACGALLGAEREYRGREAGLKSHAGLAVACCLAILVSAFGFSDAVTQGLITLDPSRIAAGVEGGIGFACAAVIWRSRSKVIGLTTAINIWATANVGMACGAGMFFAGAVITGVMLFIHVGLGSFERWFFPRHNACTLTITFKPGIDNIGERVGTLVTGSRATLLAIHVAQAEHEQPTSVEVELGKSTSAAYLRLLDALRALDGVTEVSCSGICASE
jgi:putative Mg2+ transporter-C (MgtC) family protein